jgi:hypothetical protein
MSPSTLIDWFGLLAMPVAVWLVAYVVCGLKRGWFNRKQGDGRVQRAQSPAIFWFEVAASSALAIVLALLGAWAAAGLLNTYS